ncbi:MAG: TrmH family RNA methyltransferase [bacterium]
MKKCVLMLDNIRSVENTGSIFRTADCLGVSHVILVGITPAPIDRFERKRKDFAKVALGAEKLISYEVTKSISLTIQKLKKEGYKIISLEQTNKSQNLKNFIAPEKFVLVVGNEVGGVSKEILEQSDETIEIEMKGKKESLNVSVATGIALFELLDENK